MLQNNLSNLFTKFFKKNLTGLVLIILTFSFIPSILNDQSFSYNSANEHIDETLFVQPQEIDFQSLERISTTGWNSTQTRIIYNNETGKVYVSWVDLFQPFTPTAVSTLYYSFGNKTEAWSSNITQVAAIDGTVLSGYSPTPDENDTVHFIFEEYITDNYELSEVTFVNETSIQSKTTLLTNSGNSTSPISVFDHEGFVHVVHIDKTDNPNGDLYYNYYNISTGLWASPLVRLTTGGEISADITPALTVDNNNTLHLVWADNRTGDQELYYMYKESESSWSVEEKITNVAYTPVAPKITFDQESDELHVLYKDDGSSNNLYYITAKTKAIASAWSTPRTLSNYLAPNGDYDIISDLYGNTFLVFERQTAEVTNIYLRQKFNNNTDWEASQLISAISEDSFDPSIALDYEGTVYVAYTTLYQDKQEVFISYGIVDSDGDGLSDLEEINTYFTDPYSDDSDNDSLLDFDEVVIYNTDPNDFDSDNDLMPDGYEIYYNFNPNNATDASDDDDEDGLSNLEEYNYDTKPFNADSDYDSLSDGEEVNVHNTDPNDFDTDDDLLNDGYEIYSALDPLTQDNIEDDIDSDGLTTEFEAIILTNASNPDTDGDGYSDGVEYALNTDPLDANDFPITEAPKDYSNLIIGVLVSIGAAAIFLLLSFIVASQFKPSDSSKRKELEHTEISLSDQKKIKDDDFGFRQKERYLVDREDIPEGDKPKSIADDDIIIVEESKSSVVKEPIIKPEIDPAILEEKKATIQTAINALKNYESQLKEMLEKQMTQFSISTASREALTELAADSQTFLSEAKNIWTATIAPSIKGYEEQLYKSTVEAERLVDNCSKMSDKILDILVNREIEIVDEDTKREDIKRLAQEAVVLEDKEDEKVQEGQEEQADTDDAKELSDDDDDDDIDVDLPQPTFPVRREKPED